MNAFILNRSAEPPKDGWYQIEVNGTWPAGTFPDGRPRKQVIDEKAITSIVNRFQQEKAEAGENFGGMLVDLDHLSHDLNNTTEAHAWLQELEIRNNTLHGRLDLSDLGETAIRNKRVKWFSTEYDPADCEVLADGTVRPLRLAGLAFTNRPNNRGGKPISNRDGKDKPGGEQHKTKPNMQPIALKLGLPADADEAAILTKLATLMSELETLKAKSAEGEADLVMNRFGDRIPEGSRDHWKKQLITNRTETEKLMDASFPEKKGEERIFNRGTAKTPDAVGDGANGGDKAARQSAAVHAIRNRDKCTHTQAFEQARRENPALFN